DQESQEEERRHIGRVQIVQDEQDRPPIGGVSKELGDSLEQAEPCPLRIWRARLRQVRETSSQLGEDLREFRGAGSELRAESFDFDFENVIPKGLHTGPFGWCAV